MNCSSHQVIMLESLPSSIKPISWHFFSCCFFFVPCILLAFFSLVVVVWAPSFASSRRILVGFHATLLDQTKSVGYPNKRVDKEKNGEKSTPTAHPNISGSHLYRRLYPWYPSTQTTSESSCFFVLDSHMEYSYFQILFLQHIYHVPFFLAAAFLFTCIVMALGASSCIVLRWHEDRAAWMLLGYIALQQALYGKYAPQGKWGFFVRNLCICGSLLILVANSRLKKGRWDVIIIIIFGR